MNTVVFEAIKELVAQDKTPTVALTKARLREPVPMPIIIAAVSQYKNSPDSFNNMVMTPNAAQRPAKESQLDRIEQKLDRLLTLLEKH